MLSAESAGNVETSHLSQCTLPNSLVVLIACGSAMQTTTVLDEPLGLPTAALVAGAATVVGTLWPVSVIPAVHFIERFLTWLKHSEMKMENGMVNVARAVQRASLDVRKRFPTPGDWAGYVVHGSPVMQDLAVQRAGQSSVVRGEQGKRR